MSVVIAAGIPLASRCRMGTKNDRQFSVITGASSGIGFKLAKECLEHDMDILICAEDAGLSDAADNLRSLSKGSVETIQADLATFEGVEKLYEQIRSGGRKVDALFLNAG